MFFKLSSFPLLKKANSTVVEWKCKGREKRDWFLVEVEIIWVNFIKKGQS